MKKYKIKNLVVCGYGSTINDAFRYFEINCAFLGLRKYIIRKSKFFIRKEGVEYRAEITAIMRGNEVLPRRRPTP